MVLRYRAGDETPAPTAALHRSVPFVRSIAYRFPSRDAASTIVPVTMGDDATGPPVRKNHRSVPFDALRASTPYGESKVTFVVVL